VIKGDYILRRKMYMNKKNVIIIALMFVSLLMIGKGKIIFEANFAEKAVSGYIWVQKLIDGKYKKYFHDSSNGRYIAEVDPGKYRIIYEDRSLSLYVKKTTELFEVKDEEIARTSLKFERGKITFTAKDTASFVKGDLYLYKCTEEEENAFGEKIIEWQHIKSWNNRNGKFMLEMPPGKYKIEYRFDEVFPEVTKETDPFVVKDTEVVKPSITFERGKLVFSAKDTTSFVNGDLYLYKCTKEEENAFGEKIIEWQHIKSWNNRNGKFMLEMPPGKYKIEYRFDEVFPNITKETKPFKIKNNTVSNEELQVKTGTLVLSIIDDEKVYTGTLVLYLRTQYEKNVFGEVYEKYQKLKNYNVKKGKLELNLTEGIYKAKINEQEIKNIEIHGEQTVNITYNTKTREVVHDTNDEISWESITKELDIYPEHLFSLRGREYLYAMTNSDSKPVVVTHKGEIIEDSVIKQTIIETAFAYNSIYNNKKKYSDIETIKKSIKNFQFWGRVGEISRGFRDFFISLGVRTIVTQNITASTVNSLKGSLMDMADKIKDPVAWSKVWGDSLLTLCVEYIDDYMQEASELNRKYLDVYTPVKSDEVLSAFSKYVFFMSVFQPVEKYLLDINDTSLSNQLEEAGLKASKVLVDSAVKISAEKIKDISNVADKSSAILEAEKARKIKEIFDLAQTGFKSIEIIEASMPALKECNSKIRENIKRYYPDVSDYMLYSF